MTLHPIRNSERKHTRAPETDSSYERCVLCGAETGIRKDTPVSLRRGYVEGGGQLCPGCWRRLCGG